MRTRKLLLLYEALKANSDFLEGWRGLQGSIMQVVNKSRHFNHSVQTKRKFRSLDINKDIELELQGTLASSSPKDSSHIKHWALHE